MGQWEKKNNLIAMVIRFYNRWNKHKFSYFAWQDCFPDPDSPPYKQNEPFSLRHTYTDFRRKNSDHIKWKLNCDIMSSERNRIVFKLKCVFSHSLFCDLLRFAIFIKLSISRDLIFDDETKWKWITTDNIVISISYKNVIILCIY